LDHGASQAAIACDTNDIRRLTAANLCSELLSNPTPVAMDVIAGF
jgi:hypothetical protein